MNYDKFLRRILLFSSYNYQLLYREARDYMAAWWYRLHAVLKVTELNTNTRHEIGCRIYLKLELVVFAALQVTSLRPGLSPK